MQKTFHLDRVACYKVHSLGHIKKIWMLYTVIETGVSIMCCITNPKELQAKKNLIVLQTQSLQSHFKYIIQTLNLL